MTPNPYARPNPAPNPYARPNPVPQSAEGNCSSAWRDIKSTPSWITKVLLLALVNLIPILDWNNKGYMLDWGCEVVRGKRETLPQYKISGPTFTIGLYAQVIAAVCWIAFVIFACLLNIIPIFGLVVAFVLYFFVAPFIDLLTVRSALFRNFEEGFNLKETWELYKRKIGSAIFISIVPRLLTGLIALAIAIVGILLILAITGGFAVGISGLFGGNSGLFGSHSSSDYMTMIAGLFGLGALLLALVIFLAVAVVICVIICVTVADVIVYRAYGHLVARSAPSWAAAAARRIEEEVLPIPESRMYY